MQWYNAPNGFCFDYLWCVDDPIIDDKRSVEYNVERRVWITIATFRYSSFQN